VGVGPAPPGRHFRSLNFIGPVRTPFVPDDNDGIENAARKVRAFGVGLELTTRIAGIEAALSGCASDQVGSILAAEDATPELLTSALQIKALSGQINVLIHAAGILAALPFILDRGEVVESLSLGAGNTGKAHDVETSLRIAEFKFIEWRGGAEAIRQNNLFQDVFNLVSAETDKRRQLFVLGTEHPLRFLGNRRALSSVLSKNASLAKRFRELHGENFKTVNEYWATVKDRIEIVDLHEVIPALGRE
jgi:hypothetical protein